jgi:predicted nucleic acid-binding Zn ribbon protein
MSNLDDLDDLDDPDTDLEEECDGDEEFVCPACRKPVAEDAPKCPHCGDWITPVEKGGRGGRIWFFVAVALMILAMLMISLF